MNRLTHKYKNKSDSKRFVFDIKDYRKVCNKVGQIEDILEKYNVKSLEELDCLLWYVKEFKKIEEKL